MNIVLGDWYKKKSTGVQYVVESIEEESGVRFVTLFQIGTVNRRYIPETLLHAQYRKMKSQSNKEKPLET